MVLNSMSLFQNINEEFKKVRKRHTVECRTAIDLRLSPIRIAHRLVPRLRPESSLVPLLP